MAGDANKLMMRVTIGFGIAVVCARYVVHTGGELATHLPSLETLLARCWPNSPNPSREGRTGL
jgi:hypothetical protein